MLRDVAKEKGMRKKSSNFVASLNFTVANKLSTY
jgi:hypothetical protein